MIKLIVNGACKECPLRNIKILDGIGEPIARCEHQTVCKYIEEEGYKDTATVKKNPLNRKIEPRFSEHCATGE